MEGRYIDKNELENALRFNEIGTSIQAILSNSLFYDPVKVNTVIKIALVISLKCKKPAGYFFKSSSAGC
jgi:hypothetical protein